MKRLKMHSTHILILTINDAALSPRNCVIFHTAVLHHTLIIIIYHNCYFPIMPFTVRNKVD